MSPATGDGTLPQRGTARSDASRPQAHMVALWLVARLRALLCKLHGTLLQTVETAPRKRSAPAQGLLTNAVSPAGPGPGGPRSWGAPVLGGPGRGAVRRGCERPSDVLRRPAQTPCAQRQKYVHFVHLCRLTGWGSGRTSHPHTVVIPRGVASGGRVTVVGCRCGSGTWPHFR